MAESNTPVGPSGERREKVVATLSSHFAADRLTLDELEQRLDVVHRATTVAELEAVLDGLPALQAAQDSAVAAQASTARPPAPLDRQEWRFAVAVMSGVERRGHWVPGARNLAVGIMGGAELDFRDAQLAPGVTEVTAFACMGGVSIIVPPWVRVESGGFALMGGFEGPRSEGPPPADAPVLRVNGVALMGGVEVTVRLPGETARDARRRRKAERKALKEGGRRRLPGDD